MSSRGRSLFVGEHGLSVLRTIDLGLDYDEGALNFEQFGILKIMRWRLQRGDLPFIDTSPVPGEENLFVMSTEGVELLFELHDDSARVRIVAVRARA